MGEKKDNLLLNEQALSEDELNEVTAGFNFLSIFSAIGSLFGLKKNTTIEPQGTKAGLTRPDGGGFGSSN